MSIKTREKRQKERERTRREGRKHPNSSLHTRNGNLFGLCSMLPVRALLSGRVVTRSYPIPWLRFNSTRHDASNQDKKENNVLVETDDTHPLAVAPAAAPAPATTFSTQRPLPSESNLNDKPQSTAESTSTSSSPSGDQQHPSTSDKPDSWKGLSTSDLEVVKQRIREWTDQAAINIRERADDFTAQSKATFSQLGAHLNKVTGYEEIEALKREVVQQGLLLIFFQLLRLVFETSYYPVCVLQKRKLN